MDGTTADFGALAEAVVFLCYFNGLEDPRQQAKVTYPLEEILLGPDPTFVSPSAK